MNKLNVCPAITKAFENMTNVNFSSDELNILNKGYNYAPSTKSLSDSRLLEIERELKAQ